MAASMLTHLTSATAETMSLMQALQLAKEQVLFAAHKENYRANILISVWQGLLKHMISTTASVKREVTFKLKSTLTLPVLSLLAVKQAAFLLEKVVFSNIV
jgi:hypothetical protein